MVWAAAFVGQMLSWHYGSFVMEVELDIYQQICISMLNIENHSGAANSFIFDSEEIQGNLVISVFEGLGETAWLGDAA